MGQWWCPSINPAQCSPKTRYFGLLPLLHSFHLDVISLPYPVPALSVRFRIRPSEWTLLVERRFLKIVRHLEGRRMCLASQK